MTAQWMEKRGAGCRVIALQAVIFLTLWSTAVFATLPGAPAIGPTSAGSSRVQVNFTPPVSDGGSPILDYTVTSSPDGITATGPASPITVTGLTNGKVYTFSVTARNIDGTGSSSAASNNTAPRLYAPPGGVINNLVVFIRFSDQPAFVHPLSYYDGLFNSAVNSLKNFYLESSYGALTINSTFYPTTATASDPVLSYQDPNPVAYYQGAGPADRETVLITNALNAIKDQIPPGLNLDSDGDGYIDHITFEVFSSNLNPQPVTFNSRATYDTSNSVSINGLKVGSYTWVTATQDSSYPAASFASVEIHEMGHNFGFPDLRNNFNSRDPVGNRDVMSISFSPVHSGAYMKNRFTGWIPAIPEITAYGDYTLNDLTQGTNNSWRINLPNSSEFLVLEYRRAAGPFESRLPGSGLCITRINEAAGIWGNMNGPPFFIYYFRPNGTVGNDGAAANLFQCLDGAAGQTQFNDFSNPACFRTDGSPCGISIYNIGTAGGGSMSFSVGDPAATIVTHSISGILSYGNGSRVSGATVSLTGNSTGEVITDNLGKFLFTVNAGGSYTVTPTRANVVFSPLSRTVSGVVADQTLNFTATKITNTISGTVTNSAATPQKDIPMFIYCAAGGNYVGNMLTDTAGKYSFVVDAGSTCDVYPNKAGYFFKPNTKTFTNVTTDQVQDYTTNPAMVTLSGKVTYPGSPLSDVAVNCPGAVQPSASTDAMGKYSFSVSAGDGILYTVTPASAVYKFAPLSLSYPGLYTSQANQDFVATLKTVSSTGLDSSLNPSIVGQAVTFTATLTGSTPTGSMTFNDGATPLCIAVPLVNGQAQCAVNTLTAGHHDVTAAYSGDGNNTASTSPSLDQRVKLPQPTIAVLGTIPVGTVGAGYGGFYITTTNTTGLTVSQGALPPGLAITVTDVDPVSGMIVSYGVGVDGTPTARGVYGNIIIAASNSDWTVSLAQPISITVKLPKPTIAGNPATIAMVGKPADNFTPTPCNWPFSSTCYATGFSITGTVPPGLSLDPITGVLNGTPTVAGVYDNLVINAINDDWATPSTPFTITVAPEIDAFITGHAMGAARQNHTATTLANGKVLVTGGQGADFAPLASAELYDPVTDTWSQAGTMSAPRVYHTATLLKNGQVLVVGGFDADYNALPGAELYDPADNAWHPAQALATGRSLHTTTLLADGRVLVAGGYDTDYAVIEMVEIYDPASGGWAVAAPMTELRNGFSPVLLGNGKVLVSGGGFVNSAELYDPQSDSWSATATQMLQNRNSHISTLLADGRVLVSGGLDSQTGTLIAAAELYDPTLDSWSVTGSLAAGRLFHNATLLADGKVLVTGGDFNNNYDHQPFVELYDPASGVWTVDGVMAVPRTGQAATLLVSGRVLVIGGNSGTTPVSATEAYTPYGDGHMDGTLTETITIADALKILRLALGLESVTPGLMRHGDMNRNSSLNVVDAYMALKRSVGL